MAIVWEPTALNEGFADDELSSSSWCLVAGLPYQYHHPLLLEEALLLGGYSGDFTSVLAEPEDEVLVHNSFSSSVLTVDVPAGRRCQEEVYSDAMDQNYGPVATRGMPTVVPCQSEFGTANWLGFRGGNSTDAGGKAPFGLLYPSTSSMGSGEVEAVAVHGKATHKRPFAGALAELETSPKKQCGGNRKSRANKAPTSPPNDTQNLAAKNRREKISERLKILQELVPNGTKVDLVTMLEKAISYVKFLQLQVQVLAADEFWLTQDGKAPEISQVKDALAAILSSSQRTPSS